jgi:hypothetical protein
MFHTKVGGMAEVVESSRPLRVRVRVSTPSPTTSTTKKKKKKSTYNLKKLKYIQSKIYSFIAMNFNKCIVMSFIRIR